MASNFVDDIEHNSEDEFWIAASYVSVFYLNQTTQVISRSDKFSDEVG